jgi:hypothetical protein
MVHRAPAVSPEPVDVRLPSPVPAHFPVLVVALVLAPVLVSTVADPDLWGHVRFGLDMLATRSLPAADPYSFTQDVPWVNHEWLTELLMALAYTVAGPTGLVILKTALVGAFAALVFTAYRRASPLVSVPAVILALWGAASITSTLRPQLWTLIATALLSRLLLTPPRRSWLIALPILFALWVNFHGGWIVGAGMLTVWAAVELGKRGSRRGLIVAIGLVTAGATLANPYGWQMWRFLAGTVRMSREIREWQPLFTLRPPDWLPWVLALALTIASLFVRPRPAIARLLVIALLAYASARVSRIAPLLVVAVVLLLQPTVCAWRINRPLPIEPSTRGATIAVVAALLVAGAASTAAVVRAARCIPMAGDWSADVVAGEALAEASPRGRLVTWFDWGEFALWHLGPQLRISIDGRRETIYSNAVLASHYQLYDGSPAGLAYLERLAPDYIWLPAAHTRVREWAASHGYRIDLETAESFVAVHNDRARVRAPARAPGRCFPGLN